MTKTISIAIGAILAVLIGLAILLILFRDAVAGWAIPRALESALDRNVSIDEATVGWNDGIALELTGLVIANPYWTEENPFASVSRTTVELALWPLFGGNVDVRRLHVQEPVVALIRQNQKQANWLFGGPVETTEGGGSLDWLQVRRLTIEDGSVTIEDAVEKLSAAGTLVAELDAAAPETKGLSLNLDGETDGEPFVLEATVRPGSAGGLTRLPDALLVKAAVEAGRSNAMFDGQVDLAASPIAVSGAFEVAGQNLANLSSFSPTPLPPTPPYDLAGNMRWAGQLLETTDLAGRIGDTAWTGNATIDLGQTPTKVDAIFHTKNLDFDDLGPLIGAPPSTSAGDTATPAQKQQAAARDSFISFLPNKPLDFAALRRVQGRVAIRADAVSSPPFAPLQSFDVDATFQGDGVTATAKDVRIADGKLTGQAVINPTEGGGGAIDIDFLLDDARIGDFLQGSDYADAANGRFDAKVVLDGAGASVRDMVLNGEGALQTVMRGGAMSALVVEGIGIDIGEALVLFIGDNTMTPINCARVAGPLKDGVFRLEELTVDTDDSVIRGSGQVALKSETLDLKLAADAKDSSILDLAAPVHVKGDINAPSISIGEIEGLGLFEAGNAKTVDCSAFRLGKGEK